MSFPPAGHRQEREACGLYATANQVVLRIFLSSYYKNSDELTVVFNINSDDIQGQIYIYSDEIGSFFKKDVPRPEWEDGSRDYYAVIS